LSLINKINRRSATESNVKPLPGFEKPG
jgi:hypothetical protein